MIALISLLLGIFVITMLMPMRVTALNHDFKYMLKAMDEKSSHIVLSSSGVGLLDKMSMIGSKILKLVKYEMKLDEQLKKEKILLKAGISHRFNAFTLLGLKIGLMLFGCLYGSLMMMILSSPIYRLCCFFLPIICFVWPSIWAKNMITIRQNTIQREMPFVLSSIAIVVESGQSLTQAIQEVAHQKKGILVEEFKVVVLEIEMGFSRVQAFERMMDRVQCTDLSIFLSSMIQSIEKGTTGISELLMTQSDDLWKKRTEKAKSLAEKASIKLFMPLLVLVLPSMLIFVLTPAILSLIAAL